MRIVQRQALQDIPLLDGIHPVLARVYRTRNIQDLSDLDYSLKQLYPWQEMMNIEAAAKLLHDAIQQQRRILIIADFDADGATSCVVMLRCLRAMGAKDVNYLVPNRFEYGYGLTPEIVDLAKKQEPDLIITVDNGISSITGVKAARDADIDVLVTDHHLPGRELPNANVILNPNQKGDAFKSKTLAGVGVVFYLMIALRHRLQEQGWYEAKQLPVTNLASYLDLVALGTIADVVGLDKNNRILVSQGLARIRSGKCVAGIRALLNVSDKDASVLIASDIGFSIAPRLNAAGRLTDMSLGIECLLTDDDVRAEQLARELHDLNQERKSIQEDMQVQAETLLSEMIWDEKTDIPAGVSLYRQDWHPGVVGILASKIKERLHRPVIIFAPEEGDTVKGSARSVEGIHIRDVLEYVHTQHPDVISKFGGHAMAAGLSLPLARLQQFQQAFAEAVEFFQQSDHEAATIYSDGALRASDLSLHTAETLRRAGPWGQGFSEPVFDGTFELLERKILAEKHLKMRVRVDQESRPVDAIAFFTIDAEWPESVTQVTLAYQVSVNYFMGRKTLQLLVQHVEPKT